MRLNIRLKKILRISQHLFAGFIAFVLAYSVSSSSIVRVEFYSPAVIREGSLFKVCLCSMEILG